METEKINLPAEITASFQATILTMKGPKGEIKKKFTPPGITITTEKQEVSMQYQKQNNRNKKMTGTIKAHVRNMIKGLTQGYTYKMKICSGHFPMTVTVSGSDITIKNFFGEKSPRKLKIIQNVKVKVEGQEIIIESPDKEAASSTAAAIEQITRRTAFDRRVFMDGIYITSKDDKEIK